MTFDSELRKKLQILLGVALVVVGARTAYIVYQRYEERKLAEQPKPEPVLRADYYVIPKKLHPYDLKSARELTRQPVWVKVGYYHTYYPYDVARRKTEFGYEAGTLLPLQKLSIQDVVTDAAPQAPAIKQVLARFAVDGKNYAVPIGSEQGGEFKIYSDDIFFVEDPHELYKHWPADMWKAIDKHEVQPGMSELQATCAIGAGSLDGTSTSFSRTLHYANGGKPLTITYHNDKAVEIKAGT